MFRTTMLLAGLLVSFSVHATAAEDWRSRLNPTERACLERIEATEGQISEIKRHLMWRAGVAPMSESRRRSDERK